MLGYTTSIFTWLQIAGDRQLVVEKVGVPARPRLGCFNTSDQDEFEEVVCRFQGIVTDCHLLPLTREYVFLS